MLWWLLTLFLATDPFAITTSASECPSLWIKFRSSCYKLFTERLDNSMAAKICRTHGAELAVVNSREEHNFIQDLLQDNTYIGLDDLEKEGTFIWQDGSSLTYSRFSRGQPDNSGDNEHCVEMRKEMSYLWNDVPCSFRNHFICEIRDSAAGEEIWYMDQ